jgi:hypothetical protein
MFNTDWELVGIIVGASFLNRIWIEDYHIRPISGDQKSALLEFEA